MSMRGNMREKEWNTEVIYRGEIVLDHAQLRLPYPEASQAKKTKIKTNEWTNLVMNKSQYKKRSLRVASVNRCKKTKRGAQPLWCPSIVKPTVEP